MAAIRLQKACERQDRRFWDFFTGPSVRKRKIRVVFSTAVNLTFQSGLWKSLSRVRHMMSLPWARVMEWIRIGTPMVAIWEWLATCSLHMSGMMWLYCNQIKRRLCLRQVSNRGVP